MSVVLPTVQRAAVVTAFNQPHDIQTNFPVPSLSSLTPGQCLVKMEYAGVCHSDLHLKLGDWRKVPLPRVGGHEGVGVVVAIGSERGQVHGGGPEVGDRVGIKWLATVCGRCEFCVRGNDSACPMMKMHGYTYDGTFSDYVIAYIDYVTPIPKDIDPAAATVFMCAGVTVYNALRQSNTVAGNWVCIPGAGGGLGHLAVQFAVAMGLRVLAIDTGEPKKELVLKLGAEKWLDFRESADLVGDVKAATGGGPQAALVTADSPTPYNQAIYYIRPFGTLIAVGMPAEAMKVNLLVLAGKNLRIIGSALGNRMDTQEALDLGVRGKVRCDYTLKRLEDLNSVFDDMEEGKLVGRVVIKF